MRKRPTRIAKENRSGPREIRVVEWIVKRVLGRASGFPAAAPPNQKSDETRGEALSWQAAALPAILAGVGWAWAVALLTTRKHLTAGYFVMAPAFPAWGFLALSTMALLIIGLAGVGVGVLCHGAARAGGKALPWPTRWLLASWLVPLADIARLAGWDVPVTFLEPVLIVAVTGAAARLVARDVSGAWQSNAGSSAARLESVTSRAPTYWLGTVWVLAVVCASWWYYESQHAYDNYLLGYNDFGHFAWRVANTWEGRGFLKETPGLPAYWDHFNPGLALLAPLWGLWPDARLFFVIQAFCLAIPAPLVYSIARRLGAVPGTAAMWAAAYLLYPAVGQFNLSGSYGWHPISLALPLIFAALAALLNGRRLLAGAACVLACSFQEDVLVVLACLALMMSLEAWWNGHRHRASQGDTASLADQLPWWGWLAACAVFLVTFATVFTLVPFSRYQVGRFGRLGASFGEVLLSPVLRPRTLWNILASSQNVYFLLTLAVPLGLFQLRELRRGWIVLAATFLPLAVLLAWDHELAKGIAFWYSTTLVPLFFLAVMVGAASETASSLDRSRDEGTQQPTNSLTASGVAVLAACAIASVWYGAMPWTAPTLTDLYHQTYRNDLTGLISADRDVGSPGNKLLNRIVQQVGGPKSSVVATGRIAAHLLRVRRLETVAQMHERWTQLEAEVGPRRSPIELFDYVVLDTAETFYQSREQCQSLIDEARQAGYNTILQERDILILRRPGSAPLEHLGH